MMGCNEIYHRIDWQRTERGTQQVTGFQILEWTIWALIIKIILRRRLIITLSRKIIHKITPS